jgi:hypothetical protein
VNNPEELGQRYQQFYVWLRDFRLAAEFATHILDRGLHFATPNKPTYVEQVAFTTALIVSYTRPFAKKEGPIFPVSLVKYTRDEKQLHNRLRNQRNKIYAHSDDLRSRFIPVDDAESPISAVFVGPAFTLTQKEVADTVQKLLAKLIDVTEQELEKLTHQLRRPPNI